MPILVMLVIAATVFGLIGIMLVVACAMEHAAPVNEPTEAPEE